MRYLLPPLALLAGCAAPLTWQHPTMSVADQDRAYLECDLRATEATAAIRNSFEAGWMQGEIRHKCLRARGFEQVKRQ